MLKSDDEKDPSYCDHYILGGCFACRGRCRHKVLNGCSICRAEAEEGGVTESKGAVFCFGSNLAGIHGAGAARFAVEHHGAIYGQGIGLQGNSYAIPTKDASIRTLPLHVIYGYVETFLRFAVDHPELTFRLTPIGCGLAGYTPNDIAPMFVGAPANVEMPEVFLAEK